MKKSRNLTIMIVLLFLSFIILCVGISVSIFNYFGKGTTNNVIETGKVVFSYSDANGGGNGIYITNAFPIPDDMGKVLAGEREYFDFSVSATAANSDLNYEIVVNKDQLSTLDDQYVKIYLTTFEGSREVQTPLTIKDNKVVTYSQLLNTTNPLLTGKTIYFGTVKAGEVAYGRRFRLRMWVKELATNDDYTPVNDKTYFVKVNVAASSAY